jgi:PQQ-dependent catabolism-associated CXXCW motif protein
MAFSCHKPMLPVRLSDLAPAPGLAFFLKIRHWTDAWGPKRDGALARLLLELQTLTGNAPSWAPKVGPAAPPPLTESPPPSPPPPAPLTPPPFAIDPAPASRPARNLLPLMIIGAVLLAAIVAVFFLTRRAPQTPPPGPNANGFAPPPTPPVQPRSYANELTDYGIPGKSELEANVGSFTPLAIPIGVRVTTEEVQRMLADNRATPIDVLGNTHAQTLPGALYMPAGGLPGTFEDGNQAQFALQLVQATGGDTTRPLIFFCLGASCWESYNAALRANAAGYSQVYWYRGGLAAWQEAGLPMMPLPAPYGGATAD